MTNTYQKLIFVWTALSIVFVSVPVSLHAVERPLTQAEIEALDGVEIFVSDPGLSSQLEQLSSRNTTFYVNGSEVGVVLPSGAAEFAASSLVLDTESGAIRSSFGDVEFRVVNREVPPENNADTVNCSDPFADPAKCAAAGSGPSPEITECDPNTGDCPGSGSSPEVEECEPGGVGECGSIDDTDVDLVGEDIVIAAARTETVSFKNPIGGVGSLTELLLALLNALLILAVPIVGFFFVYAGFLYVIARGNEETLKKAKSALGWAVVGTIIVFGSLAIVTIIQNLANAFR